MPEALRGPGSILGERNRTMTSIIYNRPLIQILTLSSLPQIQPNLTSILSITCSGIQRVSPATNLKGWLFDIIKFSTKPFSAFFILAHTTPRGKFISDFQHLKCFMLIDCSCWKSDIRNKNRNC